MPCRLHFDRLPRTLELGVRGNRAFLRFIDQRFLPEKPLFVETTQWHEAVDAIKTLAVRGAPAIGIAGAAAVALWLKNDAADLKGDAFSHALSTVAETVAQARPTAINLAWAVDGTLRCINRTLEYVRQMVDDDERTNRAIGKNGAALVPDNATILTHCNAGSLATSFYGTALGVVYAAAEQGKVHGVYADETRPVGQGARLTVWELARAGVPVTLNCDNMAATLMAQGRIDCVIVGADRIARNGDTARTV